MFKSNILISGSLGVFTLLNNVFLVNSNLKKKIYNFSTKLHFFGE